MTYDRDPAREWERLARHRTEFAVTCRVLDEKEIARLQSGLEKMNRKLVGLPRRSDTRSARRRVNTSGRW